MADDTLDHEPGQPTDALSSEERKVLGLIQKIGLSEALAILENARFLGYEIAMSRLVGAKPIVEVDLESTSEARASGSSAIAQTSGALPIGVGGRANSASA